MAIASYTSNTPQIDIGNYLGQCIAGVGHSLRSGSSMNCKPATTSQEYDSTFSSFPKRPAPRGLYLIPRNMRRCCLKLHIEHSPQMIPPIGWNSSSMRVLVVCVAFGGLASLESPNSVLCKLLVSKTLLVLFKILAPCCAPLRCLRPGHPPWLRCHVHFCGLHVCPMNRFRDC